jgi:hypothetical protein
MPTVREDLFQALRLWLETFDLPFEAHGHDVASDTVRLTARDNPLPEATIGAVATAYISNRLPLISPLPIGTPFFHPCHWCGELPACVTDGLIVRPLQACAHADGWELEYELAVPSGVLVAADGLGDVFDRPDFKFDRTAYGQIQQCLAKAKLGCASGGVGDTCPDIFRVESEHYVVASTPEKGEAPGESVGQIVTGGGNFDIADKSVFAAQGGDLAWVRFEFPVRPGVYKFVVHSYKRDFDIEADSAIFAEFSWVRECD